MPDKPEHDPLTERSRRAICHLIALAEYDRAAFRTNIAYIRHCQARALYLHDYGLLPYGRVAEAMRELFGCALSAGTLANLVAGCAAGLIETELQIKKKLRRSSVIHADETGMRVGQRLQYVHVASTQHLTHYAAAPHRGRTAMDEINLMFDSF